MNYIKSYQLFENNFNKIRLKDIFIVYPDEDELIWNFVGSNTFNKQYYKIKTINILNLISDEFISNFKENAESWQKNMLIA